MRQITIEELAVELVDQRILNILRQAIGPDEFNTVENLYWLSRKHIAEDLLDKYDITPKDKPDRVTEV